MSDPEKVAEAVVVNGLGIPLVDVLFALVVIALTFMYLVAGLGFARMAAKIKGRELIFIDFAMWPIPLMAFAVSGQLVN